MLGLVLAIAMDLHRTPLLFHKIYIGGTVLTMDSAPVAEAVVTRGSRITYVGNLSGALALRRWYTSVIDLQGKTLMPGFIDAHSHFLSTGLPAALLDLNSSPAGSVDTLEQLYNKVEQAAIASKPGKWIVGFNYDNTRFPSASHPDRLSLDKVSADNPVYIRHHSGHMGVANSLALRKLLKFAGATTESNDQAITAMQLDSSVYSEQQLRSVGTYSESGILNGLLQEEMAPALAPFLKHLSLSEFWLVFRTARDRYARSGYTMVQEGSAGRPERTALLWLSRLGLLPMRVSVWLNAKKIASRVPAPRPAKSDYFQADTIKIIVDGSPQGFTAHLSEPYLTRPAFSGFSLYQVIELSKLIESYQRMGFRVAIHANGDQAIESVINAVAIARRKLGLESIRGQSESTESGTKDSELIEIKTSSIAIPEVILVHAQAIRQDQLDRLNALEISPSFFSSHSWYWGDWHRTQTLGERRAATISPAGSAERRQLDFSLHTDAPVTSPNPWELLWIATERRTRTGFLLGKEERIGRSSALQAMTVNPAKQAGVFSQRGSIAVGKLADMIVVSDNPLKVEDVRSLIVEETIVNGISIFEGSQ